MSSGALVVSAGASVGMLAARMADDWSQQAALQAAAEPVAQVPGVVEPRPKVVTRVRIRRITPDPVIVRRKVIVHVPAGAQAATRSAPRSTGSSAAASGGSSGRSAPSRRVIAPAPQAAPAPAPKPVAPQPVPRPAGTTSKAS